MYVMRISNTKTNTNIVHLFKISMYHTVVKTIQLVSRNEEMTQDEWEGEVDQ